jgi:c-di-AMP phosphodiesterase-like protein
MNFHKNIFTYYVINFLTILSMVGAFMGYWESAILIFCVCLALMAIDLKTSDLEIEIVRIRQMLLENQISMTSEPCVTKDEVDQEVE